MPSKLVYKSCKNSILMMYNKVILHTGPNLANPVYSPVWLDNFWLFPQISYILKQERP